MRTRTDLRTHVRRLAVPASLAAGAVLLIAGPASAHVTVQPDTATAGAADQVFAFRVPDESDAASTVKVDVYFPTDHPIASALVSPVPGWTSEVKTTRLARPIQTDDGPVTDAVSEIVWTGGRIAPGQYQDFTVDFGQLPKAPGPLVFKTLQTYSDGSVVRWIDTSASSGTTEPQHPAPTLNLSAPGSGSADTSASTDGSHQAGIDSASSGSPSHSGSGDEAARVLGGAGVALGGAGIVLGVLALLGRRRAGRGSAS